MSLIKRIMISLPENLLREMDGLATGERRNRSAVIRDAMQYYLAERKRFFIREQMKKGYQEMAQINLALALEFYDGEIEIEAYANELLVECK